MSFWKHIKGFGPLLSAVVVAACIGGSLAGYEMPVYEVQAAPVDESEDEIVQDKAESDGEDTVVTGNWDLEDGVYEGCGNGYSGQIRVAVTISAKTITEIEILSESDDEAFFNLAKTGVIASILKEQSLDVDTVTGATYSSKGIIAAVRNALTGETDTSELGSSQAASPQGSTYVETVQDASAYKDGTYYGTGTGFSGPITVKVVITDGKIASIEVVESSDDASYFNRAKTLLTSIVSSQSTNVDTVSGATYSSAGLINAVRNALSKAAVDGDENSESQTESNTQETNEQNENNNVTGNFPYDDGIYYGTAEGYMDDITVAVVIKDKTIQYILVTEENDDEAFFNRAKTVLDTIMTQQTVDVDTVSGATYSSNGLINAVKAALESAKEATESKNQESTDDPSSEEQGGDQTENPENPEDPENPDDPDTTVDDSIYVDGTYPITVVCHCDEDMEFNDYNLTMNVTIENDKVTSITDISGDGKPSNDSYIRKASQGTSSSKGVVAQIVEKGNADDINVVSRATCSSNAIIEAVKAVFNNAKRVQ